MSRKNNRKRKIKEKKNKIIKSEDVMNNKQVKTVNKTTVTIIIVLIALVGCALFQYITKPKTGYIVISQLYDGFELKIEMEKKYLATKNARQKILDSLAFEITLMEKKMEVKEKVVDNQNYDEKVQEYLLKKKTFDEDNDALSQKYDEQIITQLNQYVKDFGKAYQYTYIFGTGGNGSLMYANESEEDITKKVLEYINKKYNGED